jgi:hypothetical protein
MYVRRTCITLSRYKALHYQIQTDEKSLSDKLGDYKTLKTADYKVRTNKTYKNRQQWPVSSH